jgi:hypothetical protein
MPDFAGSSRVKLQPSTTGFPMSATLPTCTSATANDGVIPYGDALSTATVALYSPSGANVTSMMMPTAATVRGSTVSWRISYYEGMAYGLYKFTIVFTCNSGYTDELDGRRIWVSDT